MGRSQESFNKKEVRNKKEKKRKDKEKKRLARKENTKSNSLDDMIAYVDEHGNISDTPPDPGQKKEVINAEDIQVSVPRGPLEEVDPNRKGTVTYFNSSKGFGFITDQETRESVFVHVNNTLEEIREGNLVSFEVEKGQKGPVAVKVQVVR
jgi:cold shock CspA family protein